MSTGAKIDSSLTGGLSGLRAHMQKVQVSIKECDARTAELEAEKKEAHRHWCQIIGKQNSMKNKITDTEEKIEATERKLKELTSRTLEKEQFLNESKIFTTSLKIKAPNESEITAKEANLQNYKNIYHKSYERYQAAKSKKIELELQFELMEGRSRDAQRRLGEIQTELEYNLVEEARRSEGCRESIDSAFKCEKNCLDLERLLTEVEKRKDIASKKIKKLQPKVDKAEEDLEETNFERRRVEATIKEILMAQYKDS